MKAFEKTDPEFNQIITDFVYEEAYNDCTLDVTEKYMCILAGLLGVQGKGMFRISVAGALEHGVDPVVIKEVIYQASAYLGIGRTYDFLNIANDVFEEKNIAMPLEPQSTTNKETRLQAGVDKQCELFGEHMRNILPDSTEERKHINTWLAANCFGDYYAKNRFDQCTKRNDHVLLYCITGWM